MLLPIHPAASVGSAPGAVLPNIADRIALRTAESTRFVQAGEIQCILAEGAACKVTVNSEQLWVKERLGELEQRLPMRLFFRVNRSCVINLSRVTAFRPKSHGDQQVFLAGGIELVVSRTRRKAFLEALKTRGASLSA